MPGKENNIITRDPDEQMKGYLIYGAKAGAVAGCATSAVVLGAQRYTNVLKNFSPSAKLATILTMAIGTTVIAAENAVYQVRRPDRSVFRTDEAIGKDATLAEKLFYYRHPIVGGTFAAAVAAGAMMYANDPYRSGTQKFLNVRLYGQGLALAALFGSIGIGSIVAQRNRALEEQREKETADRLYGKCDDGAMLDPKKKK